MLTVLIIKAVKVTRLLRLRTSSRSLAVTQSLTLRSLAVTQLRSFTALMTLTTLMVMMIIIVMSLACNYCIIIISVLGVLRSYWGGSEEVIWGVIGG